MSDSTVLFTTRMRKATRKIHNISDALVNAKFAIALSDEKVWAGGLFVFYHVFAYLEDAKERLKMAELDSLFVHKSVFRKHAFEADLQHYLGDEWRTLPKPESLELYLNHLKELEKNNPNMLMAYVYHLYLGLLSGGQILAGKRRIFGEKKGVEDFYKDRVTDFSDVVIPNLKNDFRAAMDKISETMTPEEQQSFIDESNQLFMLNNSIVGSVGGQNQVVRWLLYKLSMLAIVLVGVVIAVKMR